MQRELFGGAITAELPLDYIDASTLRDVPDTQEVFLDSQSSASLIADVLQRIDVEDPFGAIRAHFEAVAHDNGADLGRTRVDSVSAVPSGAVALVGTQYVRKTARNALDEVRVFMALFRVPEKNADLLITANAPVQSYDDGALSPEATEQVRKLFEAFVTSLRIVDYGLFA